MLQVVNVQKSYGPRLVLAGVSFGVARTDRMGIVGANGVGKTTLLRVMAGEEVDAGEVRLLPGMRAGLLPQDLPDLSGTVWDAMLSGAPDLQSLHEQWANLAAALSDLPHDEELLARYGELHDAMMRGGGFDLDIRARVILRGLGLGASFWERLIPTLSGGERTRLNLARTLLPSPELLLLDEPTNHLDVEAIEWLETFLAEFPGAVVVASHDRRFLNTITTRIVELDDGRVREYQGNYDAYRAAKARELASRVQAYEQHRQEVDRLQAFVRRQLGRAAQIQGGPKRGRDHYGRIAKKAARRGQAARARLDRVAAQAPPRPTDPDRVRLRLEAAARSGPVLAQLRDLTKGFEEQLLFANVNLTLLRGARVGLVGPNGSGKTTLLRLLAGDETPTTGELWRSAGLQAGVLSQHAALLDDKRRPLDVAIDSGLSMPAARGLLASLLFRGDRVFQPVCDLSGGERTRLALMELLVWRANLLLLDEPTNHLDFPSRERLEEALETYPGTLVVASHDRFLLDRLCTSIWAIEAQTIREFQGTYSEFRTAKQT